MCQDPYIVDGVARGIPPEWPIFFSLNLNSAIILTNKDYAVIKSLVLNNSVVVSLNVCNSKLLLCSQYSSPSGDIDNDFAELSDSFPDFDDMLIAGDFNVPLLDLGYTRQTERSEIFLEHLTDKNLAIINDLDATHTFVQGSLRGKPDLTLGGINICNKVSNWSVDDKSFSFSDHLYICYSLRFRPEKISNIRYKTKNKSFTRFNKKLKEREYALLEDLLMVRNVDDLDRHVNKLMAIIIEISDDCFRKGELSYKPTMRWFSQELRIHRNKVSACYKRYKNNPDNDMLHEIYKKNRNDYKKKVKIAKRQSWARFCEKTNDTYGNLYKYISGKNLRKNDLIFTRLDGSSCFDTYNDVAEMLMREHFDIHNIPENPFNYRSQIIFEGIDAPSAVTSREIKYALNKQNNNKAPGFDKLDANIIKNVCGTCMNYIKRLFTKCLAFGHFPDIWKRGLIIFFRKRNKDGLTARSYRPISLLCIIAKILERIINIRTMTKLENINFWDSSQHGFREKHSTVTAMAGLKSLIRELLRSFKYVALVSIDIQAAFDAVVWRILAKIIDSLPISEYLKATLKNYVSNRLVGFNFTHGVRWFDLFRGCPQGSCLGPFLWLVIADFLLKQYKQRYQEIISYADDFVVLASGDTRSELERNMNERINWFHEICQTLELTISKTKCVGILFGRFILENRHPIFKIGNVTVPIKSSILYLGFHIDSKLNWITHIEHIREKVKDFVSSVSKTNKRDRGLHASYRKIWYQQVIEKQITYGYEVWFSDLKSHALLKLSSCQRIGLLSIISTYRSVSTDALCVITGVTPLHIKLKYDVLKYDVQHGDKSINIEDRLITGGNLMKNLSTSDYPKYNDIQNLYFTNKPEIYYHDKGFPIIFTDGSKMQDGVGAAYTVFYNGDYIYDYKVTLNKDNSIYQAELQAIKAALYWFVSSEYGRASIFTDNKASFMVLQRTFPVNDIVKDIFDILIGNKIKSITIGWTRAHVGTEGNERADRLAKEAIDANNSNRYENLSLPISFLKRYCRENTVREWQNYWKYTEKGRDTYMILKKVDNDFLCASQVVQYFLTGHGSFPTFLKKIGKRSSDKCTCGTVGDVKHYLFGRCPMMPYIFYFDNSNTVSHNIRRIIFNKDNYFKLCQNYNVLNENYSFIRYKF